MQQEKITAIFDQQAATYDEKWGRLAPINGALHLLTGSVLSGLPTSARILCVGAGTGAEILYLARKFPDWQFTAVEPSAAMLEVFRCRAEEAGIASRCVFHCGYLDSLPQDGSFDAATSFLVSQFILDRTDRAGFFHGIADRLRPEGILVSSDLAGDISGTGDRPGLLEVWLKVMRGSGTIVDPGEIQQMREAYTRDVAVLLPREVGEIIALGGFDSPLLFFQAGMIHAWHAKRSHGQTDS
ncbi:class I SAM-dependent methyltransferase [Luteolibacter yonseiensis]|uniref:Class I SAM-dependent methyltransferase n=1 Tax=Luteolibacter yonseiensis TaxID=1144680 RepID=A0A934VBQ9_9BACT|nr:class I SAM-dependent methyltransferase [Luteolibacter yonseiensis]MBK1817538.1 class I SAM-dependent methyltransferase [Luteolibacter yonseiensis]